jgi:hypothetical protein
MSDARDDAAPGDPNLTEADRALLESAVQETRDPADAEEDDLAADSAVRFDVGTQPVDTSGRALEDDGYAENADGLDAVVESVRRQAEDHATGDDEDYTG